MIRCFVRGTSLNAATVGEIFRALLSAMDVGYVFHAPKQRGTSQQGVVGNHPLVLLPLHPDLEKRRKRRSPSLFSHHLGKARRRLRQPSLPLRPRLQQVRNHLRNLGSEPSQDLRVLALLVVPSHSAQVVVSDWDRKPNSVVDAAKKFDKKNKIQHSVQKKKKNCEWGWRNDLNIGEQHLGVWSSHGLQHT